MTTIENILIEENSNLRSKIKELESRDISYAFEIVSLDKPLHIRGILIAEGVWKGVKYSYEQLKKAINSIVKSPTMRIDHGRTDEFGLSEVGVLTKVRPNDLLRAIEFEADITNEKAMQLVQSKVLDSVSIKGKFSEVDTSISPPIGLNYVHEETSLTSSPACEFCNIFNVEMSKCLKDTNNNSSDEGDKMSTPMEFYLNEDDLLVEPENLEEGKEGDFELMKVSKYVENKCTRKAFKAKQGYYPNEIKKAVKKNGTVSPKYGYYGQEEYPTPTKEDEDKKMKEKKLSEDIAFLEELELGGSYKEYMKNCLKEGGDIKSCAAKWKNEPQPEKTDKELSEELDENVELAEFKCPICDFIGKSLKEFKTHWEEVHGEKYGAYKQAKQLMKELVKNKELRANVKKIYELSETKPEPTKPTPTPESTPTPAPAILPVQSPATPIPPVPTPVPEPVKSKTEEEIINECVGKEDKVAELLLTSERKYKNAR